MNARYHFLMLEDVSSDADLLQRELHRGGLDFDAQVAVDRKGFLAALATGRFDVVFADYHLPDMTGLEAIDLAHANQNGVPVIIVTGALGDESAIETLKHGAADYVMKERIDRVVPAAERALREAANARERQRLDAELRTAQRQTAEMLSLLELLYTTAPVGLGFVDRDLRNVRINARLAAVAGRRPEHLLGRTVAESVPELWPAVEGIYNGVLRTGEAVLNQELTGRTAAEPDRDHTWISSYYPVRVEDEVIGVGVVVLDITEIKEAARERDQLTRAAAAAIAAAVDARDPYTAGHQRRVGAIASAIAMEVELDDDSIEGIKLAAEIHDIGKIGVPAEILQRPGQLAPQEFELLKLHPQAGYDIVAGINFPWPIAEMIRQHHENLDGSGYPQGLRGDEILVGARIIRVADVLEAMSSHRPYRPARGAEAALAEIESGIGSKFDVAAAQACLRLYREGRLHLEGWTTSPLDAPPPAG